MLCAARTTETSPELVAHAFGGLVVGRAFVARIALVGHVVGDLPQCLVHGDAHEQLAEIVLLLDAKLAGLDTADEGKGERPVDFDRVLATEVLLIEDLDEENVLGADHVIDARLSRQPARRVDQQQAGCDDKPCNAHDQNPIDTLVPKRRLS